MWVLSKSPALGSDLSNSNPRDGLTEAGFSCA
jgi:hypothetical protein